MGNYRNGTETKNALYNSAKRNFYTKGYHNTSIKDIVSDVNANLGLFTYYFDSKEAVGVSIIKEMVNDITMVLEEPLEELYHTNDLLLIDMVEYRTLFKCLANNANLARYYLDISATRGYINTCFHYMEYFMTRLIGRSAEYPTNDLIHDKVYASVAVSVAAGMEMQLARDICNRHFTGDLWQAVDYFFAVFYSLLFSDKELLANHIIKSKQIVDKFEIKLHDDFSVELIQLS